MLALEAEDSVSEDDYESSTTEQKFLLEEIKSSLIKGAKSDAEGQDTFLFRVRNWNWKNITFSVFVWVFFFLCNAAISVMGSFFPEEVGGWIIIMHQNCLLQSLINAHSGPA